MSYCVNAGQNKEYQKDIRHPILLNIFAEITAILKQKFLVLNLKVKNLLKVMDLKYLIIGRINHIFWNRQANIESVVQGCVNFSDTQPLK